VSVSGTCSLFDGMCTIATGSFLAEPTRSSHLLTAFPPAIHAHTLLLDPLLPGPLQRRGLVYARAARAAGRAGDGLPGAHDWDPRPRTEKVSRTEHDFLPSMCPESVPDTLSAPRSPRNCERDRSALPRTQPPAKLLRSLMARRVRHCAQGDSVSCRTCEGVLRRD